MADWDPTSAQPGAPSKPALHRARVDYRRLCEEPLEGIVAVPDAKDAMRFHVLVSGPTGTPYEGGSFYFLLRLPNDYPHSPPRARIMTTGGGVVRFNPNLYANGKVGRGKRTGGRAGGPARGDARAPRARVCSARALHGGRAQRCASIPRCRRRRRRCCGPFLHRSLRVPASARLRAFAPLRAHALSRPPFLPCAPARLAARSFARSLPAARHRAPSLPPLPCLARRRRFA